MKSASLKNLFIVIVIVFLVAFFVPSEEVPEIVQENVGEIQEVVQENVEPVKQASSEPLVLDEFDFSISLPPYCGYKNVSMFGNSPQLLGYFHQDCSSDTSLLPSIYITTRGSIDKYIEVHEGQQFCIDGPATCVDHDWTIESNRFDDEREMLRQRNASGRYSFATVNGTDFLVLPFDDFFDKAFLITYITFVGDVRLEMVFVLDYAGRRGEYDSEAHSTEAESIMQDITINMPI